MAVEGDDVYLRSVMDEDFALPSMDFDEFTFGELDVLDSLLNLSGTLPADLPNDVFNSDFNTSAVDDLSDSLQLAEEDNHSSYYIESVSDNVSLSSSSVSPVHQSQHASIAQLLLSNDADCMNRQQPLEPVLDVQTLQLLSQAGIHQPAERQIRLHSELARHLSSNSKPNGSPSLGLPKSNGYQPNRMATSELAKYLLAGNDDSESTGQTTLLSNGSEVSELERQLGIPSDGLRMKQREDNPTENFLLSRPLPVKFDVSQFPAQFSAPSENDTLLAQQLSAQLDEYPVVTSNVVIQARQVGTVAPQSIRPTTTVVSAPVARIVHVQNGAVRPVQSAAIQPSQNVLAQLAVHAAQGAIVKPVVKTVANSSAGAAILATTVTHNVSLQQVQHPAPRQIVITTQAPQQAQQVPQISIEQLRQLLTQNNVLTTESTTNAAVVLTTSSMTPATILPALVPSPTPTVNSQGKIPIARITSAVHKPSPPASSARPGHARALSRGSGSSDVKQQPRPSTVEASALDSGDDPMDKENGSTDGPEVKSSHNIVEKRYRMSINDKLGELRELVDGKDSKLNKSGVLRKAIDHIRYLKSSNKRLKHENTLLKFAIAGQQTNVEELISSVNSGYQHADRFSTNAASPAGSSDISTDINSPLSTEMMDSESTLSPPSYLGLLDRTRLFLCMFMLSLFFFNPFAGLIAIGQRQYDGGETASGGTSRTLLGTGAVGGPSLHWADWLLPAVLIWVINSLVAVGILITLFVFGEPVTKNSSSSSVCYWRHRSQADVYLLRGSYVEAVTQMRGCLQSLGRPLPTTKLDLVASLFWNVIRQILHRAGLCRWIEVKAGSLWRNVTQQEIKISARDATVIYHKLLQLHLTDYVNQGMWAGLNLALCTVNLADVAADSLPKDGVAEIYVLAAMTIRFYFTARLQFFARYFLSRARRKCLSCSSAVTMSLQWLCHPIGHRYFVDAAWSGRHGHSVYSCCINDLDPLAHITRGLREHVMEKALRALVTPGYKDHVGLGTDNSTNWIGHNATEALTYIHLLTELSSGFETSPKIGCGFGNNTAPSTKNGVDESSRWWAGILAVAAHWLAATDDASSLVAAERFYPVVDSMPKSLQNADDPFIKCLYIAYKARRLSLHGATAATSMYSCLQLCNRAGELLTDSINHPDSSSQTKHITKALQLVVCDWLLNTRTEVWIAEHGAVVDADDEDEGSAVTSSNAVISGDDLSAFQHDLTSLRCLAHSLKAAVPRVFLHEATLRLMTGASPVNVLYNRSLRRRRRYRSLSSSDAVTTLASQIRTEEEEDIGPVGESMADREQLEQRDRAGAILQACRHHLTHQKASAAISTANVAEMLDEAAAIYARLGDRKAVQDCHNVLMKLSDGGDDTAAANAVAAAAATDTATAT